MSYRIIISDETEGKVNGGSAGKSVASSNSGESLSPFGQFVKDAKAVMAMAPVSYAMKYADLAVTTAINRVELRTGNSIQQQKIEYAYSTTKQLVSAAGSIIYGVASQNYVAAVAGAMSLVGMGVKAGIEEYNLNIHHAIENVSIRMANVRAGAGGERNGTKGY